MYKIHKLSSAEYKKIYSRPSVLLVFLFLAIVVFFSSILFNPKANITKQTYNGSSVQKIFDNFKEDNLSLTDTNIVLNKAEEKIDKVKNLEDKLTIFKEKLNSCYNYKATLKSLCDRNLKICKLTVDIYNNLLDNV